MNPQKFSRGVRGTDQSRRHAGRGDRGYSGAAAAR